MESPDFVFFNILEIREGAVDSKGYASKVALYPGMLTNGLQLPFRWPIRDVLEYFCLASAQLHPKST